MKSIVPASWLAFLLLLLVVADVALADESFILATGRRDPRIYTIDFNAALKPRNNNTPNAIVSRSENWLTEDGSNRISIIDRKTGGRRAQIEMALGHPGHACPDFPVPFVSPTPPPTVPFAAPDPLFGCWPNPEFLALGHASDGKAYLFSG